MDLSALRRCVWHPRSRVCCDTTVSLSLSLPSTPGSFVHCVLIVQMYVWVWPGIGYGVSGEFSRYYSTQRWGRLKTRSAFDRSSPEHAAFVTCLDLFRFPHSFDKTLCSRVWFISLTRCWFVLSKQVDLDSTSFVLVFVDMNHHYAKQSRGRSQSRYRDPWMGYRLLSKLIALDFRKRTREKTGTLGGNDVFFRKSLSQTFSLIRLDFSDSPRFLFFNVVSSPHNRQLGTHTGGVEGNPEAPGSKTLPQWTLNLRVYAHTCRQTKEM